MNIVKSRMAQRGQGGFTLIELLVVIAILAILAGVVVFAVGNSTQNAGVAACKTERASIITGYAAAKAANYANTNASAETVGSYLSTSSGFKYFATPITNSSGGVARINATQVTPGDCAAITTAEVPDGSV